MKSFNPRPLLAAGILVLLALVGSHLVWQSDRSEETIPNADATSQRVDQAWERQRPAGGDIVGPRRRDASAPRFMGRAVRQREQGEASDPFAEFAEWADRFARATSLAEQAALEAEGIRLAAVRREALADLIQTDPQRALELALSFSVSQSLPDAVADLLEQPVEGFGQLAVIGVLPLPGRERETVPVCRMATVNGTTYRAFVYGRRLSETTRDHVSLQGIAVGNLLAVSEELSPNPSDTSGSEPTLSAASAGPPMAASLYTEGRKRLLIIRVDFPDYAGEVISTNTALNLINGVNSYYAEMSYGRTTFALAGAGSAITPTLRLPLTSDNYADLGQLRNAARSAAAVAGYDLALFDFDIACTAARPVVEFAGLAYIGGPGAWLANGSWSVGTGVHELGHNLGLNHANFWNTSGQSIIGPGTSEDYGDPFDTMGTGGAGPEHFNARYKNLLGWIADSDAPIATASGLWRIYAHDHPTARGVRALRIAKDTSRSYWVEFRQKFSANPWLLNGVGLRWAGPGNEPSNLLDTTPGSLEGKEDSPILIGRTFSDWPSHIHITAVAKGNTFPESIDVAVFFGPFVSNTPPTITIRARSTATSPGSVLTFSAVAADDQNDDLAYAWDFGDGTFGLNNSNASHSWQVEGEYVVRCVASDMKGGTASGSAVVRIGSPATYGISGRVLSNGVPVQGIRVSASPTRFAFTDSDGTYSIVGLTPGNYVVDAAAEGQSFTHPYFNNPVTVGPDVGAVDFLVLPSSGPNNVTLVTAGAVWKYRDNGTTPGSNWTSRVFSDSGWASGLAQLGYGDGDEATVVSFGPSATSKHITTYFRHSWLVPDASIFTNLTLGLLRDDGGVVYLNGVEVFRNNMPAGPITATTLAASNSEDPSFMQTSVHPALLLSGTNVLAVEIHQFNQSSSDISFDLFLDGAATASTERLPLVYIASPPDNEVIYLPTNLLIRAEAFLNVGTFTKVEFFLDDAKLGEDANAPFSVAWNMASYGQHKFYVVATDERGNAVPSRPVNVFVEYPPTRTTLIPQGARWRYLDAGVFPGASWIAPDFNDRAWPAGFAQLGYGDGDEATVLSYGSNPNNKPITTYFRHSLVVEDAASFTGLTLRLLRDDGAVVYLNGFEIYRNNMPGGVISHTTLADTAIEDGTFYELPVEASLLVPGTNVVAVEIHQASPGSSDISFDFELIGHGPARGVYLTSPTNGSQFAPPGDVLLRANAVAAPAENITRVEFFADGFLLGEDDTFPFSFDWNDVATGTYWITARAWESGGSMLTSDPVMIRVASPPVPTQMVSSGARWKYLDDGSDPGPNWRRVAFDDSVWASGFAQFGYGGLGEVTTVSFGSDPNRKHITTYFRHSWVVNNPPAFDGLRLRLLRDDGAAVYLNDREVFRSNLQPGLVSHNSLAVIAAAGPTETFFVETNLSAMLLLPGTNVLAVEVHQASIGSPDLAFDLELAGLVATNLAQGVYLTSPADGARFTANSIIELSAFGIAGTANVSKVEFFANGTEVAEVTVPPYATRWSGAPIGLHALAAVVTFDGSLTLTSPLVNIVVETQPPPVLSVIATLVSAGALWRYYDDESDPGSTWTAIGFDDRTWSAGWARLGFGFDGESTPTSVSPITTYFRRSFVVTNPAVFTDLHFSLQRDDGAIVFLNGMELFRSNMPAGAVTPTTLAANSVSGLGEQEFVVTQLPAIGLVVGTNVLAVEVHQASALDSDLGFDLELIGIGSLAPRIVLTRPAHETAFIKPVVVTLEAAVLGGVGQPVARVEFYADAQKLGEATAPPYRIIWNEPPIGEHTLVAQAADGQGGLLVSAPVRITVGYPTVTAQLIPRGTVWKYLDDGSDQNADWLQPACDDSAWLSGLARLGYGGDGEETTVSFGPNPSSKYITTYFRRSFSVPAGIVLTNLLVRLLRDDGAVVHLNGVELFRSNMPLGPVSFDTLAALGVGGADEQTFFEQSLPGLGFSNGFNLLAVEVHQFSPSSSDVGFDLELLATGYDDRRSPPALAIERVGTTVQLTWRAEAAGWSLYAASDFSPAGWSPVPVNAAITNGQQIITLAATNAAAFYRLQKP